MQQIKLHTMNGIEMYNKVSGELHSMESPQPDKK